MFPMKNGLNIIHFLYKVLAKFSNILRPTGCIFLKRILTNLYHTKCNEISICHLGKQKHVSYEKWFKYYIFLYTGSHRSFPLH